MLAGEETLSRLLHLLMYVNVNIPLFSDCPETPAETAVDDAFMATLVLIFALVVFGISYVSDPSQNQSSFSPNVHLIHASLILCLTLRFV